MPQALSVRDKPRETHGVLLPCLLVKIHRQQPASLVQQERVDPDRVFADKVRTNNVIGEWPEFSGQAINLPALLVFGT